METKPIGFINELDLFEDRIHSPEKNLNSESKEHQMKSLNENNKIQKNQTNPLLNETSNLKNQKKPFLEEFSSNDVLGKRIILDKKTKENDNLEMNSEVKNSLKIVLFSASFKEEEEKKSLGKQISKIKYFWRGTNMNYPFAFQKIRLIFADKRSELDFESNSEKNDECCFVDNEKEEGIIFEEDLSNKMINPAEKYFK